MFLHIGSDFVIPLKSVIAILDLEKRQFLKIQEIF